MWLTDGNFTIRPPQVLNHSDLYGPISHIYGSNYALEQCDYNHLGILHSGANAPVAQLELQNCTGSQEWRGARVKTKKFRQKFALLPLDTSLTSTTQFYSCKFKHKFTEKLGCQFVFISRSKPFCLILTHTSCHRSRCETIKLKKLYSVWHMQLLTITSAKETIQNNNWWWHKNNKVSVFWFVFYKIIIIIIINRKIGGVLIFGRRVKIAISVRTKVEMKSLVRKWDLMK